MQIDIPFPETDIRKAAAADGITHISTGIAVVQDNKILMVRRAPGDYLAGVFELPGGGVDEGESILDGALRELVEETGLRARRILGTFDGFDYSTDKKPHVRQINFIVQAEPVDVKLNPDEHDAYLWVDTEVLQRIETTDKMRDCVADALTRIGKTD